MTAGAAARPWLVVLGDSVAAGWRDPDPAGGWIGWTGRITKQAKLSYENGIGKVVNVAKPGAAFADMARDQLSEVRHLRPELVVVNGGMTDALNGFDRPAVTSGLDEIFGWARAAGAAAIAAPVPRIPVLEQAIMSDFRRTRTLQRIHDLNAELDRAARESGMTFLPQDAVPGLGDPSHWGADGLHLNAAGHAYVAEVIAEMAARLLADRTT